MVSQRSLCLLWTLLACYCFSSSVANNSFDVGGKDGWVSNPSENYNHWAGRNRFLVNDSLVFKYKKGSDSVLLVTKDDYNSCSTKKPLKTMESGSSVFRFDKSGSYFFISGNEDNCRKGQKLTVAVLHVRPNQTPAPVSQPPAISPKAPSPVAHNNPSTAPSKSPSPSVKPPTSSQVPSVSPISPSPFSNTPSGKAPTGAPVPAKSLSPSATTPTLAPSPSSKAPTGAPGPSQVAKTPQMSPVPSTSPTSAPGSETSPSPLPNPPAPAQSPTPPSPLASTPSPSTPPVVSPTAANSPSPSSLTPEESPSPSSSPPTPTPESSSVPSSSPGSNESSVPPAPSPSASWIATPSTVTVILASFLISSVIGVWP